MLTCLRNNRCTHCANKVFEYRRKEPWSVFDVQSYFFIIRGVDGPQFFRVVSPLQWCRRLDSLPRRYAINTRELEEWWGGEKRGRHKTGSIDCCRQLKLQLSKLDESFCENAEIEKMPESTTSTATCPTEAVRAKSPLKEGQSRSGAGPPTSDHSEQKNLDVVAVSEEDSDHKAPPTETAMLVLGGRNAIAPCKKAFRDWHTCVHKMMSSVGQSEGYDSETQAMFDQFVQDHVHENVMLAPPTYFATYTGRGPFSVILSCVAQVFGKTFKYHRQWLSDDGREWALEFTADGLGGSDKSVRGIDLVSLDDEGRIVSFRILAGGSTML